MKEEARAAVFLLAQNRLLREALSRILSNKSDIAVVGSRALSDNCLDEVVAAAPDVLVLDFDGDLHLDLVREVQTRLINLKVIMIGMDANEHSFLQRVHEGALGYLLKDASALEIVAAVRAVGAGHAVCPPELAAALFRYVARQRHQAPSFHVKVSMGLTNREQQLVLLIGRGLTNKEIASHLQLAEQTVRNHVHRVLRKVGANDRLEAVELCRLHGLPV